MKTKVTQRTQNTKEKDIEDQHKEPLLLTFAQIEGRCYCCGKPGHKSPQSRLKDIKPKHEWHINTVQLTQTKKSDSKEQDTTTTRSASESNTNSTISS